MSSLPSRAALGALCLAALPLSAAADEPRNPLSSTPYDEVAPARAFEPASLGDFGDGRRTTGRFLPNLGRNIVGVFSKDNLRPLFLGVAAAGLATRLDDPTKSYFGTTRRAEEFGEYGQRLGTASVVAPVAATLFAFGRASNDPRFRGASYDIAQAFVVNGLYTTALKMAVSRTRPDGSDRLSFPSGHTSNAFAWATVANHHYGKRVGIPAFALAGLVGASRLESNVHHLSDVVAGAALGVIVGRTVVREDGEAVRRKPRFTVMPATDASGTGVGAAVSFEF